MALIFSSGGGRLGNQLLNIIHLYAISFEYDIDVYKLSDLFIVSKDKSLFFKIEKNNNSWEIITNYSKIKTKDKLILKVFIRAIHFYHFIMPNKKSYKIGLKNNLPKFVLGKSIERDISTLELIREAKINNVILSGWGLRNWELVLKHKKSIIQNIIEGFFPILDFDNQIKKDFLFVHVRRSDFLHISEFKDLNFSDEVWIKSITNICKNKSIKKVVIFSDNFLDKTFISLLEKNEIKVSLANFGDSKKNCFLETFVNYLYNSKAVICNASSLALSLSFLFHDEIYLPSKNDHFQKILLDKAHNSYPSSLNWN